MGYTTEFSGKFTVNPPLKPEHIEYLKQFAEVRHMKRDVLALAAFADPIREAVGLPVGVDGEFFVGGEGFAGQDRDTSIVNYNDHPSTQPALWCQWVPTDDGKHIKWDGGEKFYNYSDWMEYIVANFIQPWGYKLNGDVKWRGEETDDRGVLVMTNNKLKSLEGDDFKTYKAEKKKIKDAKAEVVIITSAIGEDVLNKAPSKKSTKM